MKFNCQCGTSYGVHPQATPGDVSLCIACGTINIYDKTMHSVAPATADDILSLSVMDFKRVKQFHQFTRKLREGIKRQAKT